MTQRNVWRRERILVFSIAVLLAAATLHADLTRPLAPDFNCDVWLNSAPLRPAKLRGKVMLIDFWEYTCINCIRTFPYVRRWNALYAPFGLVVIGVHTPEFAFGRETARVAEAVHRFGFTFPIAVDSDYKVWNAFHNEAWPAKYLIDKDGNIAFTHLGEGDYAEFERHIQELLAEANPALKFTDPKFNPSQDSMGGGCESPTPETYLGFERGERLSSPGGYRRGRASYTAPSAVPIDGYALSGRWLATPEAVDHPIDATPGTSGTSPGDSLVLHYRARSVYLVAGSDDGKAGSLYVMQDGRPLPKDARGVDVKTDSQGRTLVELAGKRMYYLIENTNFGEHMLSLNAAFGLSLYSFTFGNNCETASDRR
jgi:thiol-disulfide isomerase/thioredoxin